MALPTGMPVYDMRLWPIIGAVAAAIAVGIPVAHHLAAADDSNKKAMPEDVATTPNAVDPSALVGIQLDQMYVGKQEVTAPALDGRRAHLSVDPELQKTAIRLMKKGKVPSGAVVMLDLRSGRLLVYAPHQKDGKFEDHCASAKAPAASIFKIITAAALVEKAKVTPETKQCYRGGLHQVTKQDLVEDPERDRWCTTLADAMGRSLNTVFARLALHNLDGGDLRRYAVSFGFGFPVPFDVFVEPSMLTVPEEDLEFARVSAGFWNSTLSPIQATMIAATVASKGEMIRPVLVNAVDDADGKPVYRAPPAPTVLGRPIRPETADALRKMMETTVSNGTAFKAFHDRRRRPFLPGVKVASKTGTLIREKTGEFYTWLVGFAPSDTPEVAFAVLVNNNIKWHIKAPELARDMLRAYFASKGTKGISAPR